MIKTVGELLEELIQREKVILDQHPVRHPVTIGAMYEGLSQEVLRRGLPFSGAPISVVSGFAKGSDGSLSRQLDCMLVVGSGELIPHTSQYMYPIEQVITVIEVKKTLYQSEFDDGFKNLQSLVGLQRGSTSGNVKETVRAAFERMAGQSLPGGAEELSDPVAKQVYHQLVIETMSPARILLGFGGFKTAGSLRRGLGTHLRGLIGAPGSGPSQMPDLIMTPRAAVLKTNGLPYSVPMKDGWWSLLVSSASSTPAMILLEVVWSRLFNRLGGCPEAFGADLKLETLCRLVDYRFLPDEKGWETNFFDDVPKKQLQGEPKSWEPVFLDDVEHAVVTWLCKDELDLQHLPNVAPLEDVSAALARLAAEGLVGADTKVPSIYRLLTIQCGVVFLPDGRVVAGENNSGRLMRWVERETSLKPVALSTGLDHGRTTSESEC